MPQAPLVLPVQKALLAQTAHKVQQEQLVLPALPVQKAQLAHKAPQEAQLVLPVLRENKDLQAQQVHKAQQELQAHQVPLALLDLREKQDQKVPPVFKDLLVLPDPKVLLVPQELLPDLEHLRLTLLM